MKKQAELAFPPPPPPSADDLADRGRRAWRDRVLPMIRTVVDRITLKETASLLVKTAPQVSDALCERDNKGVRAEWLVVLLMCAPEAAALELLTALCKLRGYKAPEKERPLEAADELRLVKRALAKLAPGLLEAVDREVADG